MRRWKINKFYKFKYKECTILLILLCIHSRKSQGSITFSRFTGNYNLTLEGGQLSSLITRFQKNPISLSKCVSWLNTFQIQSAIREKKWHVFLSLLFMTIPIIIQAAFLGPWSRQVVTEVKIRPFFTAAELFMDYYCGFQIVFWVSRKKAWMMIVSCLRTLLKLERLNHDHKFEIQYKPQRVMLLLHSFWCKWEWKGKSWMYRHANNNNWLLDSSSSLAGCTNHENYHLQSKKRQSSQTTTNSLITIYFCQFGKDNTIFRHFKDTTLQSFIAQCTSNYLLSSSKGLTIFCSLS